MTVSVYIWRCARNPGLAVTPWVYPCIAGPQNTIPLIFCSMLMLTEVFKERRVVNSHVSARHISPCRERSHTFTGVRIEIDRHGLFAKSNNHLDNSPSAALLAARAIMAPYGRKLE